MIEKFIYLAFIWHRFVGYLLSSKHYVSGWEMVVGKLGMELRLADKRDNQVILAQNDACSNWECTRRDGDT